MDIVETRPMYTHFHLYLSYTNLNGHRKTFPELENVPKMDKYSTLINIWNMASSAH
jgi:hypothetical protein